MRFRTQIFLFLFLFGFAPLISSVLINLPLVLERLELFYHKAHLQNLRADFRDLDQHIASRREMVRLLSKLPEPGAILGTGEDADAGEVDRARARYTEWVNQIFQGQLDITQILFVDDRGRERFWLQRDRDTQTWHPTVEHPGRPSEDFLDAVLGLDRGTVLISPIDVDPEAGAANPRRLLSMYLASPIGSDARGVMGAVVMTIDVGGLARFYRNTLWVRTNGQYLGQDGRLGSAGSAFEDFPGLEQVFQSRTLDLWKDGSRQVIWVPMFRTEQGEPLWVGRRVDPSPLEAFRKALIGRVLAIVLLVILGVWVAARWFSLRAERVGRELADGIGRVLERDEPARFDWQRPEELRRLGENLSRLADKHVRNTRNLRAHARELEAAYRYKSEFLSNVSHELRTPLNSILLLSKMLSESESLAPEYQQHARVIHGAGKDLQSLIDNILDLSRIEAGRAVLNLETLVLPDLLKDVMELVRPQFQAKSLALDLHVDPEAPQTLVSDPDKIRQILKNFLANAVKFTSEGGVEVRLSRAGDGEQARPVRITVRDTGIGIPADKQKVIFEAFRQADGSTSRRYGGTGLGLTISLQLAELLGGTIELTSTEGQGAAFSLRLPLRHVPRPAESDREERQPEASPPAAEVPAPPEADFSGHHVLVVDEDVQTMLTLTPMLEGWGLRVTAAGDSSEALEALRDEPDCSLVLLDLQVPGADACATIEALKGQADAGSLPVIALTVDASESAVAACREAGADDFVAKPVDAAALKDKLSGFLTSRGPAEDP